MTAKPGFLGSFIGTTQILDIGDDKELLVKLRQVVNELSLIINTKDTGIYTQEEFVNGQVWFPPETPLSGKTPGVQRQVIRKVVNFGALPNTATKSVAHNITFTSNFSITRLYGAATDPAGLNYIPLPYASPTDAQNIALNCDGTNVNITTGNDRTAFTKCYVVIEYITE